MKHSKVCEIRHKEAKTYYHFNSNHDKHDCWCECHKGKKEHVDLGSFRII